LVFMGTVPGAPVNNLVPGCLPYLIDTPANARSAIAKATKLTAVSAPVLQGYFRRTSSHSPFLLIHVTIIWRKLRFVRNLLRSSSLCAALQCCGWSEAGSRNFAGIAQASSTESTHCQIWLHPASMRCQALRRVPLRKRRRSWCSNIRLRQSEMKKASSRKQQAAAPLSSSLQLPGSEPRKTTVSRCSGATRKSGRK